MEAFEMRSEFLAKHHDNEHTPRNGEILNPH